jgi:hypothetical protein
MRFKAGDLAKMPASYWHLSCHLEDINRNSLKGRAFEPVEMNGALVEIIGTYQGLLQVHYVCLNAYGVHYLSDVIPLNEQVP